MNIKVVKRSTMIYPATETPRVSLWLSRVDMTVRQPYSHTRLFYIYPGPTNNKIEGDDDDDDEDEEDKSNFFNTEIMKESLSRVLVPFYPVAGRLKFNEDNGRYQIECNAKGVLFTEADATDHHALADFGDCSSPDCELREIVFPTIDYSGGLSSFPLFAVQVTRFECGGVCLGFLYHHHVADGVSHFHFTNSWARLARGLDLSVHPVHDRATYLGPRLPPQVRFRHKEYDRPSFSRTESPTDTTMTTIECVFKLTKAQITALKLQAINPKRPSDNVSTFAVLAGHVWRSVCKARGLELDEEVRFITPVDGRSRLKGPTLPQGYFGNVLFCSVCVEKAGEIIRNPMWYVASKIQRAIKRMEDVDYLRSSIDYLESYPDLNTLVRGPHTMSSPNLGVNNWARLPFKGGDFGWGGPEFASIGGIKYEGQTYLTPSINGDGSFLVGIKLFTPHMTSFKNYLYDFKNSFISCI